MSDSFSGPQIESPKALPRAYFQVITVFPEMIEMITSSGVVGQARKKNHIEVTSINPRKFANDVHNTVDDRPFGGGDGMIMLAEPLENSILEAKLKRPQARTIYLSPQGPTLRQSKVVELAQNPDLILLCGRYSGVDQRLLHRSVDEEISIGDYVISGGELAAAVLIDAVARFIPGVLGHANSAAADSFADNLLEAPLFTRPRELWGQKTPEILLSGNHAAIAVWQKQVGILVTLVKRPDLRPLESLTPKAFKDLRKMFEALSVEDKAILGLDSLDLSQLQRTTYV